MVTWTHQGQQYAQQGATAHDGGRVDSRARGRQDERGDAGSGHAKGRPGKASREGGRWCLGLLVAFVLLSFYGAHAFGANLTPPADLVCSFTQLTRSPTGFSTFPAINAAGTRIAFISTADLTGSNPDHNQDLFLVDTTTGNLTQLTNTTTGDSFEPAINAAGTRIAFSSTADLTGGNADGNEELFLVDTTTGSFTQLTTTTGSPSFSSPAINAAGTRIAFVSAADLTGGNADGSPELFLVDTTTGSFTQLTTTTGSFFSSAPAINAAGTRIAFVSTADLTGGNADRTFELFLVDTTTGSFTQLTTTTDISIFPAISAVGTRIAFVSTADLTGGNADRTFELFLVDTTTGSFTQLTTGGGSGPAINAAGTRIVFGSDLIGGNLLQHRQLFLVDTTTGSFTQLTTSSANGSFFSPLSINAAGTRIAFASSFDLTGGNMDGNVEIFLATCLGIVNDLVTFPPLPSTFQTTADTSGCPAGFAGKFRFTARLTAKASSPALTDLRVQVHTVTNGNLLQNADSGPGGAGATLTVPQTGALADGILSPEEAVDVPFVVCLQERSPFRFFVDVLGRVSDDGE